MTFMQSIITEIYVVYTRLLLCFAVIPFQPLISLDLLANTIGFLIMALAFNICL